MWMPRMRILCGHLQTAAAEALATAATSATTVFTASLAAESARQTFPAQATAAAASATTVFPASLATRATVTATAATSLCASHDGA